MTLPTIAKKEKKKKINKINVILFSCFSTNNVLNLHCKVPAEELFFLLFCAFYSLIMLIL